MTVPFNVSRQVLIRRDDVRNQTVIPVHSLEPGYDDPIRPPVHDLLQQVVWDNLLNGAPQLSHSTLHQFHARRACCLLCLSQGFPRLLSIAVLRSRGRAVVKGDLPGVPVTVSFDPMCQQVHILVF